MQPRSGARVGDLPANTNSTTFNTTAGTVTTTQTSPDRTLIVSTTETVTVTPTATLTALAVTPANSSIATGEPSSSRPPGRSTTAPSRT
jgi:hypothetical protein